jgi:hypothetical protein
MNGSSESLRITAAHGVDNWELRHLPKRRKYSFLYAAKLLKPIQSTEQQQGKPKNYSNT